jgi:ribosomal-protein-alanine N-acetyltransferase
VTAGPAPGRTVRPARPDDGPDLARLQALLPRPSPRLLAFGLPAGTVLVSTAGDDRPVGSLLFVRGETTHVAELVVAPERRREGRARALLAALFDRVDGRVTVAVAPDNDAARACYRSVGFAVDARLPEFYDGDPALRLVRTVD